MPADECLESFCEVVATIRDFELLPDRSSSIDMLIQLAQSNISLCKIYGYLNTNFIFDVNTSHFIIHLNIPSIQAHFNEFCELIQHFTCPPSIVFLSKIRTYIPFIID